MTWNRLSASLEKRVIEVIIIAVGVSTLVVSAGFVVAHFRAATFANYNAAKQAAERNRQKAVDAFAFSSAPLSDPDELGSVEAAAINYWRNRNLPY